MADDVREKLRSEVMVTGWPELAPQFARDALLLVSPEVDLLDAGVALATDDRTAVEALLAQGQLWRATETDARAFTEQSPRFQFVIVQPWVLAQPLPPAVHA